MAKLEDLVTQASDEPEPSEVETDGARTCCLCPWSRRTPKTVPDAEGAAPTPASAAAAKLKSGKLASVVPVSTPADGTAGAEPEEEEAEADSGSGRAQATPQVTASTAAATASGAAAPDAPAVATATAATTPAPQQVPETRTQEAVAQQGGGQLGPQLAAHVGKKTLVLDLDETLVHSSFRAVHNADIIISVVLEGESHRVYVRKRPGVDEFLQEVAKLYEVVVFTASMAMYANPLLDQLDPTGLVASRLFRQACTRRPNGYTKDLSLLGRDLKNVIIIDNSPVCYALQPYNAIPISTWREDPRDRELYDLVPILSSLVNVDDVPSVLRQTVWAMED
eukprot:TRINITY_DN797_c0_g1_i1.p1 TRINITY_DN797_c0_g1~~TRINITY_DN797_c0_g1_i1.p1  ORF type:complete len:396 (-),score=73.36 TRINITY_DN797_c0_g1_i1:69-1079(-)